MDTIPFLHNHQPMLLYFYGTFFCCLLWLTSITFGGRINHQAHTTQSGISITTQHALVRETADGEFPFCDGESRFEGSYHHQSTWKSGFSKKNFSQKIQFNISQAVACFDHLYDKVQLHHSSSNIETYNGFSSSELKFLFVGDSRVRQQFFNFLKLIPDYDKQLQPSPVPGAYQGDIDVSSAILRLRVSFRWRSLVNAQVMKMLRELENPSETGRPIMIFLSMAVWHMLDVAGVGNMIYEMNLQELSPILDFYGDMGAHNTDIFSEKIHHYNKIAGRLLGSQKNILLWNGSNPIVEEYIRGCAVFKRIHFGPLDFLDPAASYINCLDYVHPGYSALSQATQLLYNNICDSVLQN